MRSNRGGRHAAGTDVAAARRASATNTRSVGWRLADVGLTVAAIGGAACIAAVIAATVFDITLIMFKTGSMSPAIPTGSLAVVRETPASDTEPGDVVTIDRQGQLPITHRVVSVADAGNGYTSITMRGDANPVDDPSPYTVKTVRTVVFALPGLANVVVSLSNPYLLGAITLGAAVLVTWAFWPRGAHRRHRAGATAAAAALVVGLAPAVAAPTPAHAGEVETVARGQFLTLRSITVPEAMHSMTPGRPVPWQVGVSVAAPEPGTVHVGISAEGGLVNPGALDLEIRSCEIRWVSDECARGEDVWLPRQDLARVAEAARSTTPDGVRELETLDASNTVWLLITVIMPTEAAPGSEATLNIHAWGEGSAPTGPARVDPVRIGGTATVLAPTGMSVQSSVALAAMSVFAGLALAGGARIARLAAHAERAAAHTRRRRSRG